VLPAEPTSLHAYYIRTGSYHSVKLENIVEAEINSEAGTIYRARSISGLCEE
jgi:hypothetical protein